MHGVCAAVMLMLVGMCYRSWQDTKRWNCNLQTLYKYCEYDLIEEVALSGSGIGDIRSTCRYSTDFAFRTGQRLRSTVYMESSSIVIIINRFIHTVRSYESDKIECKRSIDYVGGANLINLYERARTTTRKCTCKWQHYDTHPVECFLRANHGEPFEIHCTHGNLQTALKYALKTKYNFIFSHYGMHVSLQRF